MQFGESILALQVRPNDLDVLGHVNNAVVLEYLEAGRWDWLAGQGITRGGGVTAVVARAEVDYRGEIPFGPIEVRTVLESPSAEELAEGEAGYRAVFRQRIRRADAAGSTVDEDSAVKASWAVEALITVACIDVERRCLVPLDEFLSASV
ncbi:MAG TPA: acyl-CoA thioesterase [Actinocrinis sp.]|uniref:acyl-CoA thioesterase n=1 Tax=Actinocrinis sp. TaxID=1920516 RepID=UPI002DDD8306|nr:acyl-CoA thioesterase [Actinocrinis sp.]HEV2345910.1 acyl-CoA thioesterase [Actinocrinis sp.]